MGQIFGLEKFLCGVHAYANFMKVQKGQDFLSIWYGPGMTHADVAVLNDSYQYGV